MMDSSKSRISGRSKRKKNIQDDTARRSERARRASSQTESESKIASVPGDSRSEKRGVKSYLCCSSRAEDVYEQRINDLKKRNILI